MENTNIIRLSKLNLLSKKDKDNDIIKTPYKSKSKFKLINLKKTNNNTIIDKQTEIIEVQTPQLQSSLSIQNNKSLLLELQTKYTVKNITTKLNLAIGTIQKWIELETIPTQYIFDVLRLLNKNIDYSIYKSSQKDQFFTPDNIAKQCWNKFCDITKIKIDDYIFIEPSAGDSSFLKCLPTNSIGLDIDPRHLNIIKQDYLLWKPNLTNNNTNTNTNTTNTTTNNKYIVIGKPPFGLEGHTALNFINHSQYFADYVAFILPQLFEKDTKGSPRKRVKGYNLIHSEKLNSFYHTPDNKNIYINGVFQIWYKSQTKGLNRNTIDKYYTKPNIVNQCIDLIKNYIPITKDDLIIEPSAGNGAFIPSIKQLTNYFKFYDLEPEHNDIIKQNFLDLDYTQFKKDYKKIHIIGNPPFGRQSSLAIKFIKKCCHFANSISFILPKSFKKESLKKRFKNNYHLIHEIDLLDYSFLINGNETDVPCVFQIWEYKPKQRDIITKLEPIHFEFVKKNNTPDISFRRVGVNAGTIMTEINEQSEQSHYFIKFKNKKENNNELNETINKLKNIKFDFNNTVGPKSISKQELILEFNKLLISN